MNTKSGKKLHPIGIGTWGIGGTFSSDPTAKYVGAEPDFTNEDVEIEAIRYSIFKGQNYIDCAELYGAFHTDEVVGRAIANQKREDLYISDKPWKTSIGKGSVRQTVEKMLKKLGTDYLDMLYIHAPWPDVNWLEAIPQINRLIDEGVVRDFGVSNFTVADMQKAQAISNHPIIANQVDYNVLNKNNANKPFSDYCRSNNVKVIAYKPLKRQEVLDVQLLQKIASSHNVSPAQIALAWLIAKGALPIPKAINKKHIDENVVATGIELSEDELRQLDSL